MRRAVARGRVLPQSLSTDPRYGRLGIKAQVLYPLLWLNADDQGRLSGDPEEIKYAVCPSIKSISVDDIPQLLTDIETNGFIKLYSTSKRQAIQMLDWWQVQRLQWAWPSEYPSPDGWHDRLRYKQGAKTVITENWVSPESSPETSPERSPETTLPSPLTIPLPEKEKGKRRGRGKGRGNSPERSGEPSPSPPLTGPSLFQNLVDTHSQGWGRMPNSRETAQLRDLGTEISSAGGATAVQIRDAFKEAAAANKLHISYVRAILCDWLGIERNRSP